MVPSCMHAHGRIRFAYKNAVQAMKHSYRRHRERTWAGRARLYVVNVYCCASEHIGWINFPVWRRGQALHASSTSRVNRLFLEFVEISILLEGTLAPLVLVSKFVEIRRNQQFAEFQQNHLIFACNEPRKRAIEPNPNERKRDDSYCFVDRVPYIYTSHSNAPGWIGTSESTYLCNYCSPTKRTAVVVFLFTIAIHSQPPRAIVDFTAPLLAVAAAAAVAATHRCSCVRWTGECVRVPSSTNRAACLCACAVCTYALVSLSTTIQRRTSFSVVCYATYAYIVGPFAGTPSRCRVQK